MEDFGEVGKRWKKRWEKEERKAVFACLGREERGVKTDGNSKSARVASISI
jgi:hypothetical protein